MNRRLEQKKKKKAAIIEAAAEVFAETGYNRTLMADIAARAGLGKGTLYEYFDSKEDLFLAVTDWLGDKFYKEAVVGISAIVGSASDRLAALTQAAMEMGVRNLHLHGLYMEVWAASSISSMRDRLTELYLKINDNYTRLISGLIREGLERGEFGPHVDPAAVAAGLISLYDGLLLQAWFMKDFDPLKKAGNFMKVLLKGLSAEGIAAASDRPPTAAGASQ